jgi:hypothetical protein
LSPRESNANSLYTELYQSSTWQFTILQLTRLCSVLTKCNCTRIYRSNSGSAASLNHRIITYYSAILCWAWMPGITPMCGKWPITISSPVLAEANEELAPTSSRKNCSGRRLKTTTGVRMRGRGLDGAFWNMAGVATSVRSSTSSLATLRHPMLCFGTWVCLSSHEVTCLKDNAIHSRYPLS